MDTVKAVEESESAAVPEEDDAKTESDKWEVIDDEEIKKVCAFSFLGLLTLLVLG